MAPAPDHTQSQFGANDWLVEEMRERFRSDPTAVDPAWRAFFSENGQASGSAPSAAPSATPAPARPAHDAPAGNPGPAKAPARAATPASTAKTQAPAPQGSPSAKARVETPAKPRAGRPDKPGTPGGLPADPPKPQPKTSSAAEPARSALRGPAARTAQNMELSLQLPTATSVRTVPMKLVIDQRIVINNHLRRTRGGKVSYTHLIGWAIVRALADVGVMNCSFAEVDGKPMLVTPAEVNLGIAIDLPGKNGQRQLLVPSIKGADALDFAGFWSEYETLVTKAREGRLEIADFQHTTITLTNPGTIGTNHSVPRLMPGQGAIIGVGAIDYPPEYAGTDPERLDTMGVSKVMAFTSTYDHRIIQGAQSGQFLARLEELLLGADSFYEDIFASLRVPYTPITWSVDRTHSHEDQISKSARILELINAYRSRGHLMADTDPVQYRQRTHPDLEVETHGLSLWDLDREFATGSFGPEDRPFMKLRDILGVLREAYCRHVGTEYMHIHDPAQRRWFQDRLERPHTRLPREEHLRALDKLTEAEIFETFLQTKFVGQKRFSLEGGESTIVMLDEICDQAAQASLDEVCIGMAHRGRLNALANIVGKSYAQIFREFEGNANPNTIQGSGDVKYHLGAEGTFTGQNGATIKTSIAANPSHLETVDPVLEGIARAKQDVLDRSDEFPVLPVLIHGDAAFAGQGVVIETLQMSQLRGYRTGGTVHIVINNQVGFTTSPTESRTSRYATDVAKAVQAPIFHVNGDDPEACVRVARLAFEFRQQFEKDVVIDLVCYRRRGHNEGDDPSFTQPLMYDLIGAKRSVRKLYTEALIGRGDISIEDAEMAMKRFQTRLEEVFDEVRQASAADEEPYLRVPDYPDKAAAGGGSAISEEVLTRIADAHTNVPDGFTPHPKVMPQLQRRATSIVEGPIDWASAELIALGSLLVEGRAVRLTGQDTRRGTFSQRFAAVIDRENGQTWVPLRNLGEGQGKFHVFDSLLSEYGALGFEYGYSVARPEAFVLWEAQFGDFVNGAQSIIDEYISSAEAKWGQKSGVTLLLPHGYEGQGPDHSSCRLERWLQLAAEDNFVVAQPSTPASHFHMLRVQARSEDHRPLVVATPKSMLRNKLATSPPSDFTSGEWRPVLGDPTITDPDRVTTVLLCSGKVRWDLVKKREQAGREGEVAIIAVERLAPIPTEEIIAELRAYPRAETVRWVQDEPENQGPWPSFALSLVGSLGADLGVDLQPVTRPASAAPSVGLHKVHEQQQKDLLERAFA